MQGNTVRLNIIRHRQKQISRCTKSGTFARHTSPHTKANLAKEPALFQRFWDTLCFVGHIHSIRHTKTKGERTTGGLPKYGLTLVIFSICNSTVLHIQLDIIYLAFCCYLQLQFFQSSSVPGGRNTNSRTSASPVRCASY